MSEIEVTSLSDSFDDSITSHKAFTVLSQLLKRTLKEKIVSILLKV